MTDAEWERLLEVEQRLAYLRGFMQAYAIVQSRDQHPGWTITLQDLAARIINTPECEE